MDLPAKGAIEVEAELAGRSANVQLVQYRFAEPPDSMLRVDDRFRVELCLSSRQRSARACYRERWSPHRFERIGDLFVLAPGMDMLARSDEDTSLTSLICELASESVLELFDRVPPPTDQLLVASLDVRDSKVRALLLRLAEEASHPGFASEMLVELIAGQMAIELVRLGSVVTERQAQGGLAPWQLRLIDERLKEIGAAPSLTVLAELCRISVRQLTRGLRWLVEAWSSR